MKLWVQLCFLVLVISSLSRGNNETVQKDSLNTTITTPSPQSSNEAKDNSATANITSSGSSATGYTTLANTDEKDHQNNTGNNKMETGVATSDNTTQNEAKETTVSMTTTASSTSSERPASTNNTSLQDSAGENEPGSSSWGYVVLVFIIVVIIALCIILFLLRRASRTYSFDLQRPSPVSRLDQPTGTFEQVYVDDLERPAPKDTTTTDDLSTPPVANGTSLQLDEKDSAGENASQEQPEANGVETLPAGHSSSSLGDDEVDKMSDPLSSTNLFFDALGEQQNENNNNPNCSSEPFVEINLDEPAWCDQLLNSSEAPSSVLPFSPFSLSPTSS